MSGVGVEEEEVAEGLTDIRGRWGGGGGSILICVSGPRFIHYWKEVEVWFRWGGRSLLENTT